MLALEYTQNGYDRKSLDTSIENGFVRIGSKRGF